jgi:hypothetical protein
MKRNGVDESKETVVDMGIRSSMAILSQIRYLSI